MKIIYIILFLFQILLSFGQEWVNTNITPSPARFDDLFFLDSETGWAADGWGYKVYKTEDGGENWQVQFDTGNEYLRSISFLNENIGFLGTLTEHFYKTTDGGQNWVIVNIPGVQAICGLNCVGQSTVYGCGAWFHPAYIIKSTDSGESWEFIDMSEYANALIEVLFEDELNGFASGSNEHGGIVLKTTDGGITWEEIYNTEIPEEVVWKLQILHSNSNVIFGAVQSFDPLNGKLIKSTDHGETWISNEVPDAFIQGVGFLTENHGWMGGHNSGFLETFDAGETWTDTEFGFGLNRFQVFDESLAYCAGLTVYKYENSQLQVQDWESPEREDLSISISPNPTTDDVTAKVNFKRKDHLVVTLFDASGRKIHQLLRETISELDEKEYTFEIPSTAGVYYLLFHYDLGYQTMKVVKE